MTSYVGEQTIWHVRREDGTCVTTEKESIGARARSLAETRVSVLATKFAHADIFTTA